MIATPPLNRRGRPPKPEALPDGRYSVTVRGVPLKFDKKGAGFRLLTRNAPVSVEDVEYARQVLGRNF